MYVLLYVNTDSQPCYVQGTLEEINAHVHKAWVAGDIDREDWDFSAPFDLLCIEDGALTTVNHWEMTNIPQFMVN